MKGYAQRHKSLFWPAIAVALAVFSASRSGAGADASRDHPRAVIDVRLEDEAITPITARFVDAAIQHADECRAECLVLTLDTPGGLVDSTRSVVKSILRSEVPVVVFVPAGGRAASAGVFITLASHVAAMAPGSNIGAAHPVQIGQLPISPAPSPQRDTRGDAAEESEGREEEAGRTPTTPLEEKLVNDTTAWARSLAELRGRNATWAAQAVKESVSASAEEAVRERVVEFLARDIDDLLTLLDGHEVVLAKRVKRLETAGAHLTRYEMWWGERLLAVLSSPNVAFLLMIFGFYGILFELYSPGWGVAGTLGAVSLVLGFFALSILPIDYVGLLLIALAMGMFVAEAFVTSFGALTVGGIACLILGGLMLVDSPAGFLRVSVGVIVPVAAATAIVTIVLIGSIVRVHRGRVLTGADALLETAAVSQEDFQKVGDRYVGTVTTRGEYWNAVSPTSVSGGQVLKVEGREGLTLKVRIAEEQSSLNVDPPEAHNSDSE